MTDLLKRLHESRGVFGDSTAGQLFADAEFEIGRLRDIEAIAERMAQALRNLDNFSHWDESGASEALAEWEALKP